MAQARRTVRPLDAAGLAIMLGLCLVWGFQQVAMKAMAGAADPLLQVAVRSSGAAVLVWAYSRFWRRDRWLAGLTWREGLLVGALFGVEYLFVGIGLRHVGSGLMSILLYTAPLFVAVSLHLTLREERLTGRQWTGCLLSFAGVVVIFLRPGEALRGEEGAALLLAGSLCALLAGFCWGMTTVAVRLTRLSGAPFAQTLFYQLLGGALCAWPVVLAEGRTGWEGGLDLWLLTFYQTVIVCFASYLVWFWLLQRYLASRLGAMSLLSPVFAAALGAALLREPLTPGFLLATALIVAGLVTVMLHDRRERPRLLPPR
ncbi:DMT family transporter [Cereibacter johrii]|uniref:DMT family transporter n=1 Tax=Cereibacter johrii TaxID=445629 RepID=UPI000C6DBA38|nr:DMT family transporter [Cereibacter johrii]MEA5159942.1 DMT family transporter [Cereibacter johrii]